MTEKIKELVQRDPREVWTEGDVEAIPELFADEFELHDPSAPDEPRSRDDYREYVETYREAFPDVAYDVEATVADGDTVAVRYTAHGTHEGEFLGLEPTGKRVSVSGVEMYRVEDGAIVETWTSYDAFGLFRKLDLIPPLEDLKADRAAR